MITSGADPKILEREGGKGRGGEGGGRALYVGHRGWPMKKILGFRWSKNAKIMLETRAFGETFLFSIFKFSPFLYIMKACR